MFFLAFRSQVGQLGQICHRNVHGSSVRSIKAGDLQTVTPDTCLLLGAAVADTEF